MAKLSPKKLNAIRRINRKLAEYENLGFDQSQIYANAILALSMTKGINVVRRSNGTYYVSKSGVTASLAKLNKLSKFKSVASEIKKAGGKEEYRKKVEIQNFIDEYVNEIGYEIGVELFDEFGRDLENGLKNKYTRDELYDKINQLKRDKENLTEVNPFGVKN